MKKVLVWIISAIIGIISGFIILWITSSPIEAADLPHYADLTFTDIPDLDARVDSVLGWSKIVVIDTFYNCYWDKATLRWIDIFGNIYKERSITEIDTIFSYRSRRFAGLTIMWMPEESRPGIWTSMRTYGIARLWWWEKEE